jgi:hypothetical protein
VKQVRRLPKSVFSLRITLQLDPASSNNVHRKVSEADWHAFEEGRCELVRALVEQVSYDGTTGAVSLNLKKHEANHED